MLIITYTYLFCIRQLNEITYSYSSSISNVNFSTSSNSKISDKFTPRAREILNREFTVISRFPDSIIAICEREIPDSNESDSCVNPFSALIFRILSPKDFLKLLHIFTFYAMLLLATVATSDKGGKMRAFTLAETLITLGIIGVVAAITIPNLINNYQKHVIETTLKEDYSILQQAMKFTEYDDVALELSFPDNVTGAKKWFETYLAPHLKYSQICYNQAGCWHNKGFTKTITGAKALADNKSVGIGIGTITVRLMNGSNLCIDGWDAKDMDRYFGIKVTNPSLVVYIDANGNKPPNVIGKDIYVVAFTEDGLVPAGQNTTVETINDNCKKDASGSNAGYYCLMRVKNNGWEIPNDVWKIKI